MAEIVTPGLDGLAQAARLVAAGGVICYPTDTVYGLGCDPLNGHAVKKVAEAKGGRSKVMPILVDSLGTAEHLVFVTERAKKLAQTFWPGPLTLVLKARGHLPHELLDDGKAGVRCPKHAVCLRLLELCSGTLVGTSANVTGRSPAITAREADRQVGAHIDLILDGGRASLGVSSTVVDLTKSGVTLLREGPISKQHLLSVLRKK